MEIRKLESYLLGQLEGFRRLLFSKREDLTKFEFSSVTHYLVTSLQEGYIALSEVILEFLIKLSYALYFKSCWLLKEPPQENTLDFKEEPLTERGIPFLYYQALPLERTLEEGVFLPKIENFYSNFPLEERGEVSLLIKALIGLLEKFNQKITLNLEIRRKSIEEYLEEWREILSLKKIITWKEFLELKGPLSKEEVVYFFLTLLFLVFDGEASLYQKEEGEIQIFLRS